MYGELKYGRESYVSIAFPVRLVRCSLFISLHKSNNCSINSFLSVSTLT